MGTRSSTSATRRSSSSLASIRATTSCWAWRSCTTSWSASTATSGTCASSTCFRYFGNVCELDLIFNFHKAYYILDEVICSGELQESSKRAVLHCIAEQDAMMVENDKKK